MTEYAGFNDSPEQTKRDRDAAEYQAKFEAILAKPWKELTWKERLFKGSAYAAAMAVGAGTAFVAASAVSGGRGGGGMPSATGPEFVPGRAEQLQFSSRQQPVGFVPVHLTHLNHLGQVMPGMVPGGQSGSWW